jgi:prepilin-type N-terminal cleavage/methylation domain-containing protein
MKMKRNAFTLIELLVVIAIIALLLSILVPALKKVKKQAAAIVCLNNMRSLATAWQAYLGDNSGKMVNGHVPKVTFPAPHFWVETPQDDLGNATGEGPLTGTRLLQKDEINGIRKGLLFPYVNSENAYHCPSDRSATLFAGASGTYSSCAPYGSWWNSYSMTGLMNGEQGKEWKQLENPGATSGWDVKSVLKFSEVTSPGNRIVFLENSDYRGYLKGSWIMNAAALVWTDPFAIWHASNKPFSPLGFADGHAENHQWVDKTTYENAQFRTWTPDPKVPPYNEREDVEYMARAYLPRGR